jgi:putative PIN family toxin of toxin-antitoxin system
VRVVVDPGVLVSGVISEHGPPARLLLLWDTGAFDLVVSPLLLAELRLVLARPGIARRVPLEPANDLLHALRLGAVELDDPEERPSVTHDPKDDFIVALATAASADLIVSGDRDLLDADVRPPVVTPRELLELLGHS